MELFSNLDLSHLFAHFAGMMAMAASHFGRHKMRRWFWVAFSLAVLNVYLMIMTAGGA